jgi:hypothetical protein
MSCCSVRACRALLIGHEYVPSGGDALVVDCSTHIGFGAGAPICPAGSTLRSDRDEVQAEVKCDSMKRSHMLLS